MAWSIWSAYVNNNLIFKNVMYYLNNKRICAEVNFVKDFKRVKD